MQHTTLKQTFFSAVLCGLVSLLLTAFTSKPGGDSYEIYLNNKLLLKQFVHQSLSLNALSLTGAGANDQLVIYYSHCGVTGKARSISVKDSKGNVLKKWNFKDAQSNRSGMIIPVRELRALEKANANNSLSLYYAAKELPGGRMLTSVQLSEKSVVYELRKDVPVWNAGSVLIVGL